MTILNIRIVQIQSVAQKSVELGRPLTKGIGFSRPNIFQTPQSGNDLLARHARSIAVGLHELDILARTGSGNLYEHVAIVIRQQNDSKSEKHDGVSLQDFSVQKDNPMILLGAMVKNDGFMRPTVELGLPLQPPKCSSAVAISSKPLSSSPLNTLPFHIYFPPHGLWL